MIGSKLTRRLKCEPLEDRTVPAVVDPVNFTESNFANDAGLQFATGLAWAPDGSNRLYIARKNGNVRVIQNGTLQANNFSNDTVFTTSECGLIGMAFDRDYTSNGYIYLFMTVSNTQQQIVRYTDVVNDNGTPLVLTDDFRQGINRTVIVSGLPTQGANHDGGAVGIGFDNRLYWAIGDQGNNTGVNNDLSTLAAKIGRANLDGAIPNDNPFVDGVGGNNDYIWSRAWRNPFTFTFQETTGQLWVNDVGTLYEQIFKVNTGDHAGYNLYEGNQPQPTPNPLKYIRPEVIYRTNGSDSRTIASIARSGNVVTVTHAAPAGSTAFLYPGNKIVIANVTDASFNGSFDILSVAANNQSFTYSQTGVNASISSGTATASTAGWGGAVVGGAFLNSTAFPAAMRGNFIFGDINTDDTIRMSLDGTNEVSSVNLFDSSYSDIVDVAVGPDGGLYYISAGMNPVIRRTVFNQTAQNLLVTSTYQAFPEGGKVGFSVRLATAPAGNVTVTTARTAGDSDLSVFSGGTLTFTPANYNIPQAVILAAAGDADITNDLATFAISSPGLTTQTLNYTGIDAGGQSIVLNTTAVTANEGGTTTFSVRLMDPPSGTVTVNVTRDTGDMDVTVAGGATLTFNPQNYSTPQIVTIAAAEDADALNDTASISISALAAPTRFVNVTVNDNDDIAPTITSTADTTAVINALYTYDVNATGNPQPTYALTVFPAGMTIDANSGLISWTPSVTGMANVTVVASNGVLPNATQSFIITTSPDLPPNASITTPGNGDTVSGTNADFYGDGIDDVYTVRAEFRIDGILIYTDMSPGNHYHINGAHNLWNTTLLTNGPHTLRMTVFDTAGQSGFAERTVTVDNPPSVLALRVNDTVDPSAPNSTRSRVMSLTVTFNQQVNAAAGAFSLSGIDLSGNTMSLPLAAITVAGNGTSTFRLTFNGSVGIEFGSLADGRWTLFIENTLITPIAGGPSMTADYTSVQLYRLFGDINGDGTVEGTADFAAFGNVFGTTLVGSPFDFNDDGTIDGPTDFAQFGNNFGITI